MSLAAVIIERIPWPYWSLLGWAAWLAGLAAGHVIARRLGL